MEGRKRPSWEWLVLIVVLVVSIGLVGATYNSQQKLEQQKSLHYQLQALRTGELLYKSINKTNPMSLEQLVKGSFRLADETQDRHYVEAQMKLAGGKLVDPFGNPYLFDKSSGWIRSTTPGYEAW